MGLSYLTQDDCSTLICDSEALLQADRFTRLRSACDSRYPGKDDSPQADNHGLIVPKSVLDSINGKFPGGIFPDWEGSISALRSACSSASLSRKDCGNTNKPLVVHLYTLKGLVLNVKKRVRSP